MAAPRKGSSWPLAKLSWEEQTSGEWDWEQLILELNQDQGSQSRAKAEACFLKSYTTGVMCYFHTVRAEVLLLVNYFGIMEKISQGVCCYWVWWHTATIPELGR